MIVTEDTKSSLSYFQEVRISHRLPEENIVVRSGDGSDPVSVVDTAVALTYDEGRGGDTFDRVFVVIDRDRHQNYSAALDKLRQFNDDATRGTRRVRKWTYKGEQAEAHERFELILSDPCFELWLLLHFTPWTTPFGVSNLGSLCARVQHELKQQDRLPDYDKGAVGWWERTKDHYETAKQNALTSLSVLASPKTDPSTQIYKVVDAILRIGEQRR